MKVIARWLRRAADHIDPVPPDWLAEVLHVAWAFEMREHERYVLAPGHAGLALDAVPQRILAAAGIDRSQP